MNRTSFAAAAALIGAFTLASSAEAGLLGGGGSLSGAGGLGGGAMLGNQNAGGNLTGQGNLAGQGNLTNSVPRPADARPVVQRTGDTATAARAGAERRGGELRDKAGSATSKVPSSAGGSADIGAAADARRGTAATSTATDSSVQR